MKILHLADTPLSNAPSNIASCQRFVGHDARVLLDRQSNRNKVFVGGELWASYGPEQLADFFESCDVIHFHNFTWTQKIFSAHPFLRLKAQQKKCVVQFHSARNAHENFEETLSDPFFKGNRMVIAQYHPREYPECEHLVPNPLPLHEDRFRLRKGKWGDIPPLTVSYAPSNVTLKGWDYKGYDQIMPALRRLKTHALTVDVLTNLPYDECIAHKSWSHIGIEEFFTGSYHLSFLEYMTLECAPIGNLDLETRTALAKIVGPQAANELPYVHVETPDELVKALQQRIAEPDRVRMEAAQARSWIETHWSSQALMKHFDHVYQS